MSANIKLTNNWRLLPVKRHEHWQAQAESGRGAIEATIPGPWQLIPGLEKHYGSVVYQNRFTAQVPAGMHASLKLARACYQTRVLCNGQWVGRAEAGYFHTRWVPLPNLQSGDNTIHIEVTCDREKDLTQKKQILGIFTHWDMLPKGFNPGGLHEVPEIVLHGPVLPTAVRCFAETMNDQEAHIIGEIDLVAREHISVWLKVSLWPVDFDAPVAQMEMPYEVKPGENKRLFALTLKEPRRWWPKGFGAPNRYRIDVTVNPEHGAPESLADTVGLRTVEMSDYQFQINGVPIYLRGSNLAPVTPYLAHMSSEKLSAALDRAEEFNLNLLRVHCHVAPKTFYREADRRGLLIWQDMPLQWLYHPKTLPEIRRQGRRLSKYIFNHPSVIIFCCANEPIYMEDTGKTMVKQTVLTLWNYFGPSHMRDVIAKSVWRDLKKKDSTRIYLQSSGELDTPLAEGGDTHLYPGWYPAFGGLERFDWFAEKLPRNIRFVSEFGAQSLPNIQAARHFLPDDLRAGDWKTQAAANGAQVNNLAAWVDLKACTSLEDLVEASQRHQVRVSRYIIDRLRYYKGRPSGGFTHFLLNESRLGVSWSVVDGNGEPKDSFGPLSSSLEPANVFLLPGDQTVQRGEMYPGILYGVNDLGSHVDLTWRARAVHQSGATLTTQEGQLSLKSNAPAVQASPLGFVPDEEGYVDVVIDVSVVEPEHLVKRWQHRYRIEVLGPRRKKQGKVVPDRLR